MDCEVRYWLLEGEKEEVKTGRDEDEDVDGVDRAFGCDEGERTKEGEEDEDEGEGEREGPFDV